MVVNSDKPERQGEIEAELRAAEDRINLGIEERDQLIRETRDEISRRKAAEAIEKTPSWIQQIIDSPWSHRVGFVGLMNEGAAVSLHNAGATRFSHGGGVGPSKEPIPMTKHNAYVMADDREKALATVKQALEGHGEFWNFRVAPVSGARRKESDET